MMRSLGHGIAARLVMGIALAAPFTAFAQAGASTPPVDAPRAAPPITAAPGKEQKPVLPQGIDASLAGSAAAPGWNNPPVSWSEASERKQYASVPGVDTNQLIQGAGREWRELRNGPVTQAGGWLIVGTLAAIVVFYLLKGPVRLKGAPTGELIERFNVVERFMHWAVAASFVALALTGIVLLWGKHLVLPWLGYTGFSWLGVASKTLHNFVGPLFIFSLVISFLIFVRDNLLRALDFKWIARFGNMFGAGEEIPSGRFNGMEKMWFWGGLVFLGGAVSVTGLILDFPNWNQGREIMQQANVIHAIAAISFIAASLGHIYIGTIGMEGAYRAMREGYVDEEWAREHHALWYHEVKSRPVDEKGHGARPGGGPAHQMR